MNWSSSGAPATASSTSRVRRAWQLAHWSTWAWAPASARFAVGLGVLGWPRRRAWRSRRARGRRHGRPGSRRSLGPGGAIAVGGVVVALAVGGGVALAAHQVPVLVAAAPVQAAAGGVGALGVEREPGLALGIPSDGEGLQAAARLRQQYLLQWPDAEGVGDGEFCALPVRALGGDVEGVAAAQEVRRFACAGKPCVGEIAEHGVRRGRAASPAVLGAGPQARLVGVAGQAFAIGDVVGNSTGAGVGAGAGLGLRRGGERHRRRQAQGRQAGEQAHRRRQRATRGSRVASYFRSS
jgi:hypothetical protein